MGDEDRIVEVASGTVCCAGGTDGTHAQVEIAVEPGVIATCPLCSRRFRISDSRPKIDRASWPREG
jgi:uncharacterized Zn-finger protein